MTRRNRQRDRELQELAAAIEEQTNCTRQQALAAAQRQYPLRRIVQLSKGRTDER